MNKNVDNYMICRDNYVLAISIDIKNKKELILIGTLDTVRRYLDQGIDDNLIYFKKRDIGLFLQDFIPMPTELADITVSLLDSTDKRKSPNLDTSVGKLIEYSNSDNPVYAFTALLMLQEYESATKDKKLSEQLLDTFDDITYPLRFNIVEEVKRRQDINRLKPLEYLDYDQRKYPVQLLYDFSSKTKEYAITSNSTTSLLIYYLKRVFESGRYVQVCPMCDSPFIAKTSGKKTFCSDKCKRESIRLNKKRFDDRAKLTSYERAHKNGYMYWYNRMKILEENNVPYEIREDGKNAFSDFMKQLSLKKKAVKNGSLTSEEFEIWIVKTRDVIDKIMDKLK